MPNDQIIQSVRNKLSPISDSPELDAEVLLAHILGIKREQLAISTKPQINTDAKRNLEKLVQERKKGVPIAYLTGKKEFFGLEFSVNKDVLIPRPETEGLVELALDRIKNYLPRRPATPKRQRGEQAGKLPATSYKLLDVGTGSGCIAISLYSALSVLGEGARKAGEVGNKLSITATDISPSALVVAQRNAKLHKAKIEFIESDLFKNLKGRKFELVIANLPYVKFTDYQSNIFELKAEPKIALTDGSDTWNLLTNFVKQLPRHINQNGTVLMEIDPATEETIKNAVQKYLLKSKLDFHKDLAGRIRYAEIHT